MIDTIYEAAALIIPLVIAIVFHEVAHGWVANALGDPTARDLKRLSLNPIRHVDPIGTVVLPGMLMLAHLPAFGWAKPVPVNFARLRNPRSGMILVAAAGPAMNLLLALGAAAFLGWLIPSELFDASSSARLDDLGRIAESLPPFAGFVVSSFGTFMLINIFLALFNLLPIPPFDGSHIVEGVLPKSLAEPYGRLRNYGFLLVIMLIVVLPQFFPSFDPVGTLVGPPVTWLSEHYLRFAQWVAGA